jgi:hypothetical protein
MDREIDNKCCVYYHFILCVIAFILCLASIGLYLINAPYKTEDFKRRLKIGKHYLYYLYHIIMII